MEIGIIGSGRIGNALATKLRGAEHDVVVGSRHGPSAKTVDVRTAARRDVVVIAIPGAAVAAFFAEYRADVSDSLVVDASNNIQGKHLHSAQSAMAVPGVRYVRAFNTVGVENLVDPIVGGQQADMFYSSPEDDRALVEALIDDVGFRAVWVGDGPNAADVVDGVARLWFALVMGRGLDRHLAFRMLT